MPAPKHLVSDRPALVDHLASRMQVDSETGCWNWIGRLNDNGYGMLTLARKPRRAHRIAFEVFVGEIPEGLSLDHLCRNRRCCNPDHLEPVTHAENMRRSSASFVSRETCLSGRHELTEQTIALTANGRRRCRVCQVEHRRARRRLNARTAVVDGRRFKVASVERLEELGHDLSGEIQYPPPGSEGWATLTSGSQRFAAWLPVGVEAC